MTTPQMLQTCVRCRGRRIKCDSLLPACANCAKNDIECTFRDDALQADIPRSYIKSLNDRIHELSAQLTLHADGPSSGVAPLSSEVEPGANSSWTDFHVLVQGSGQDLYSDSSLPSYITKITFEVLSPLQDPGEILQFDQSNEISPEISLTDRNILTPSIIRFLLTRYDQCVKPSYEIIPDGVLQHDGMNIKKLPDATKFYTLIACAIAAAYESYKSPSWKVCAQVCRDWANELVTPLICPADGESLATILLLLIYELADPCRGLMWELLDLAIRTSLQLGWHRSSHPLEDQPFTAPGQESRKFQLVSALKQIDGFLRIIFNRPTMLSGSRWPGFNEKDTIITCYEKLFRAIYGKAGVYEFLGCPFVGDVSTFMDLLETFSDAEPVLQEAWLLFLPVCAKHRPCVFCFQEADEAAEKDIKSLRTKTIQAASNLLSRTYGDSITRGEFVPPLVASSRALISGCSIATAIMKQWVSAHHYTRDLLKCTEILSLFAPHWKGGHSYMQVWRAVMDLLHSKY